jgi:hypothetical protein
MNNYEIRARLAEATKALRARHGIDGYAYTAGYLESCLADALELLALVDTESADGIIRRLERTKITW